MHTIMLAGSPILRSATNKSYRRINRSREESRKENEAQDRENGLGSSSYQDDDDDMQL